LLQLAQFGWHAIVHWPPPHAGLAFGALSQTFPQLPQWFGSICVFTHDP
jgi:hypothetical protein